METKPNKPNIVFFFTDDQRFDTIAALNNPEVRTPNMDELVRGGTAFTRAHIPGGTVSAICMPSRAMLHTGRTLFHLEDNGSRVPEEHTLLGEHLQRAGYRTFGTGKWHNGPGAYARSFSDGDEIFFGGMWDHWNVPANRYDPTGKYEQASNFITNAFGSNAVTRVRADHIAMGKHSSELFSETAIRWLKGYDADKPYFMYISFMAPHDPRSTPEPFASMYKPDDIALPENYLDEHPFDYGQRGIRDEVLAPYPRTPELVKRHIAEYYGMITHLDHEIGKVMQALKDRGEYENTIFIFAGDNGLAVGRHGLFGKQNHYEHSIRVPLIFAGPGIPRNERREAYVYLLDIYPTLCDLLGLEIPASVEGRSLLPLLQDPDARGRDTLYFAFNDLVRSVKDDRYKLIEYRSGSLSRTQLFDIVADPHELQDLYGTSGHEETTRRLREELGRYRDEWNDLEHPTGQAFWSRF